MTIQDKAGSGNAFVTAIRGKGLILALVLAGIAMQGCNTEDSPASPAKEDSAPAGLAEAAQTASGSGAVTASKYVGNGCTLHAILADAGSRARGNAWISCDKRQDLTVMAQLAQGLGGNAQPVLKACDNVYWCGTGDMYVGDQPGKQRYTFWVNSVVDGKNHGVTLVNDF